MVRIIKVQAYFHLLRAAIVAKSIRSTLLQINIKYGQHDMYEMVNYLQTALTAQLKL